MAKKSEPMVAPHSAIYVDKMKNVIAGIVFHPELSDRETRFATFTVRDGRKYYIRLEKKAEEHHLYYQYEVPPKYIRKAIIVYLKGLNIKAFDLTLRHKNIVHVPIQGLEVDDGG